MKQIGTFEAKNQFSALLERVAQGEDVLITRHGKPIARLVPPVYDGTKPDAEPAMQRYISGQDLIDVMQRSPTRTSSWSRSVFPCRCVMSSFDVPA